jgi:hypothetical protein
MTLLALLLTLLLGPPEAPTEVVPMGVRGEQVQKRSKRVLSVPWPMYCNYIVRVIEGPGERVVVAAKRDCD